MKQSTRWISLIALLTLAVIFYALGFHKGVIAFILLGVVLELMFWSRLFLSRSRRNR